MGEGRYQTNGVMAVKMYTLTNLKTGKVYPNKTEADVAKMRNCKMGTDAAGNPLTLLQRFRVEEFIVPEPRAVSYRPPFVPKETKGSDASDQN